LAAQRAVVRMLFDPVFAEAARRDPERHLPNLSSALRQQLARLDDRALRHDQLRLGRTLRILSEEFKVSTAGVASLELFFCSAAFHGAVERRGHLALAFAAWLAEAPARSPELTGVLALETALARSRRQTVNPSPPRGQAALAAGVIPLESTRGALAALKCDNLPQYDPAPLHLVTVPLDLSISLVEIDEPLYRLLNSLPAPIDDRLRELAEDEIVVFGA
jgi:hypothetical protein